MTVLSLIFTLALTTVAHADFRSEISGVSQNEREIRWVWTYLNDFVQSCRSSSNECQTPEVKKIADELLAYLPSYNPVKSAEWDQLLEFVSEKDHPEIFNSSQGEAHRVVVTVEKRASTVYINTDRMNLPIENWVGLLIHEAVHHLGYSDDSSRIPDRIGAEIAKHFKKQIQTSSLVQFNAPTTKALTFNSADPNRVSVGFISWGDRWTSDLEWDSNPLQPLCKPNEKVKNEFVSAPVWRVNRFRYSQGVVSIRGGGFVRAQCVNAQGVARYSTMPLDANFDLKYPVPLDLERWTELTPEVLHEGTMMSPSVNQNDYMFGTAQTFLILSTEHEKPKITAGERWRVKFALRSMDNWKPKTCQLYVSAAQYSYVGQDHVVGINKFENCILTDKGNNQWQVEGEVTIPRNARPDSYYVPLLIFSDGLSERVAVPTIPTFLTVENPGAPTTAPVVQPIQMPGLKPATSMGTITDITDSFLVSDNQIFTVEFDVLGPQKVFELWLDVDIYYLRGNMFAVVMGTGSSVSWPAVLLKDEITPIKGGSHVKMTFKMPTSIQGLTIAGIKFRRFYMRTSDYSWAEIEMPTFHSNMVINSRYGR